MNCEVSRDEGGRTAAEADGGASARVHAGGTAAVEEDKTTAASTGGRDGPATVLSPVVGSESTTNGELAPGDADGGGGDGTTAGAEDARGCDAAAEPPVAAGSLAAPPTHVAPAGSALDGGGSPPPCPDPRDNSPVREASGGSSGDRTFRVSFSLDAEADGAGGGREGPREERRGEEAADAGPAPEASVGGGAAASGERRRSSTIARDGGGRFSGRLNSSARYSQGSSSLSLSAPLSGLSPAAGITTAAMDTHGSRRSSLALRKVPEHILLGSIEETSTDFDEDSICLDEAESEKAEGKKTLGSVLERTCLRSTFSLRMQLMLSFGLVSALTILFVVAISSLLSVRAGRQIKSTSKGSLQSWARAKASSKPRFVAEAFAPMLPKDEIQILYEFIRDRFAGYPDLPGYEDDLHVPFPDVEYGKNKYPIDAHPMKLDWRIIDNVNSVNHEEHVQGRWSWYSNNPRLSTAAALYGMQGACDPSIKDPDHINYYPNCTDANNDITTGGAVRPTPTNQHIYRKVKDLHPVLKSLYEHSSSAKSLGVFFANAGAGATAMFPHYEIDYTQSYTSIGCEWMRAPNPMDPSKLIGTPEMIARCHPEGVEVYNSEYNPMERGWCRDQALDPHRVHLIGPYLDAWSEHLWQLFLGRAVYDRLTNEFIGCILLDITLDHVADLFNGMRLSELGKITLANWDESGTVVVSPNWNLTEAKETTTVDDPALDLGINRDTFQTLKSLVDHDTVWDPKEVRDKYENTILQTDGKLVSCHPIPPVPNEYDPRYRPAFMVILSLEENDIFSSFHDLDEVVDHRVTRLVIFTVIVGLAGMLIVMLLISVVSTSLTRPLEWMNDVSKQIVSRFGDENAQGINLDLRGSFRFSPRTELSSLMMEFQKMVSQFSGDGSAAKSVRIKSQLAEVKNKFILLDEFQDLYQSRQDENFEYNYGESPTLPALRKTESGNTNFRDSTITWDNNEDVTLTPSANMPCRRHFGPNLHNSDGASRTTLGTMAYRDEINVLKSPLFWWIVGLVVTPLLITTISICSVVMLNISTQFSSMDTLVQEEYLQLERNSMGTTSSLRAMQASAITAHAVRDLHVLTRAAGWLLFGGLNRTSNVFTEMATLSDKCKTAPKNEVCPHLLEAPCDCEWNDIYSSDICQNYSEVEDTRSMQRIMWSGLSQDTWPNGDRNFTTYPEVANFPNTTAFWDDVMKVPGSEKGSSATGYRTTYDRLRSIAALTAVHMPLYNYDFKDKPLGTFIGFEADGLFEGYGGCDPGSRQAFWQSTESNGASQLNPALCPLGKYGYDPRCRMWYKSGKEIGTGTGSPIHITPPYVFADGGGSLAAQSSTAPLIDPLTGKHVGQALVDFIPNSVFTSLVEKTPLSADGFPILITAQPDISGADTVIGPGFTIGDPGKPIEELVIPYDQPCNIDNCTGFHEIVNEMRAGKSATSTFSRTRSDGSNETVRISYAPVFLTSFRPLNSSDFSRGVQQFRPLVYSLGIAQPEKDLLAPFQEVGANIQRQVSISIGVLAALIALASVFLIYVSSRVAVSITVPILHLLALMKNVNRVDNKEDLLPPDEHFGSNEVFVVYDTLAMLFKVLRFANATFFSGDIEKAYRVLVDALRLFKRLDNKKAVGVASNNLGNCMLTIYRTMEASEEYQICGLSKMDIISKGTAYFRDAIKLGEEAYDKFYEEEGWSASCLVFMQHLSNRYFNRAIFLLTVKTDHRWPDEAHRLGFRDLDISRDMDVEIADQSIEVGFNIDKVEQFELTMGRIRGLLSLMELSFSDEWDIKDLLDQTFKNLRAALQNPLSSDLFDDISPAGRMQQLDIELIRYAQLRNDTEEAARIALRMLIEDEFTLCNAESKAVEALVDYATSAKDKGPGGITQQTIDDLLEYQASLKAKFTESVHRKPETQKLEESTLGSLKRTQSRMSVTSDKSRLSFTLKQSNRGDFTMEVF